MPDADSAEVLAFRSFCRADDPVHAMRYHWEQRHELGWRVRDHHHLALVEEGEVVFEGGDAPACTLCPGRCRLVPPGIPHRIRTRSVGGAVEVYLLFTTELVERVRRLLGSALPAGFPWDPGAPVRVLDLDAASEQDAVALCNRLCMHPPRLPDAVEALCAVLRLGRCDPPSPYADLPPWLCQALIQLRAPARLAGGVATLARLAGRSPDHVNRTVRRHRGVTATTLVNDLRLEMAAARLRLSSDSVAAVAENVGLADPGHFHRLFKRVYGMTPRTYRQTVRS